MASNSLTPLFPSDSTTGSLRPSANNVWVAQEFPRGSVPSHVQANTSIPKPNFFELRHCTFASISSSQTNMDPTGTKSTAKKQKFISGEDKKPKKARKPKKNKSNTERIESVRPGTLTLQIMMLTMNEGF